jgi:hypothetical protein
MKDDMGIVYIILKKNKTFVNNFCYLHLKERRYLGELFVVGRILLNGC